MAEVVQVAGAGKKLRRPWGVFLLIIVTLGIYYLVWYYKTNRELADYGVGDSPGLSLLAITLGGLLIVPPFVCEWRFFRRIGTAQERAGMEHRISHVTGFLLYLVAVFFLPFEAVYGQHHLNRLWRHEVSEAEKADLGMRGSPPVGPRNREPDAVRVSSRWSDDRTRPTSPCRLRVSPPKAACRLEFELSAAGAGPAGTAIVTKGGAAA